MSTTTIHHIFKGHKTLLGSKSVTYNEEELPLRAELFSKAVNFDWGHNGPASMQLAFSILYEVTEDKTLASKHLLKFTQEVIKNLDSRDWSLEANDVIEWVNAHEGIKLKTKQSSANTTALRSKRTKGKTRKSNVVKSICQELDITQKQLAEILEVPEGTVSSWAVKDEIPRLGKKAIEFYKQSRQNQKIVDSYKDFMHLLQAS